MGNGNINYAEHIRIENRSNALEVFDQIMNSIEANGDIGGYLETICGYGMAIDFLYALRDALERNII